MARATIPIWKAIAAAIAVALIAASSPAATQPITTNQAVARLFEGPIDPAWFATSFLAQVPAAQVTAIIQSFTDQFGPLVEVAGTGGTLTTRLEHAEMPTQVVLDAEGRITGLFFGPPVPVGGDIDGFVAEIAALPGETSVLVLTNGEVVAAEQPERAMAVGSAFKLAILAALDEEVEAGRLAWEGVVRLDAAWRSLPSGFLQTWPDGTPLTIATLANLMISISDNTATDALLHILGRERVEEESARNAPFPTTAEMFKLKAGDDALLEAWIGGDEAARRQILADLADIPLPPADQLSPAISLGAEWFFDSFELCALLERVADNPAFAINPGIANASDWALVAFKGGSEPGVLNLSTFLVAPDGTTHCVVATWNDEASLEDQALFAPYAGILRELASGSAANGAGVRGSGR
jgi:beta-lactamase class A